MGHVVYMCEGGGGSVSLGEESDGIDREWAFSTESAIPGKPHGDTHVERIPGQPHGLTYVTGKLRK